MTISPAPIAGIDADPVYLYFAEALDDPVTLMVGWSPAPRALETAGLLFGRTPANGRLLGLVRVTDRDSAEREARALEATMRRTHPQLCRPTPGQWDPSALAPLCDLLDAIAIRHGRDD